MKTIFSVALVIAFSALGLKALAGKFEKNTQEATITIAKSNASSNGWGGVS